MNPPYPETLGLQGATALNNESEAQTTSPQQSNASFDGIVFQTSKNWLLGLYLVVPACLLLVVLDKLFLHNQILRSLPSQPVEWAFWAIFFNFPHIVSSFITLADREYLATYKKNITNSLLIITLIVGLFVLGMSTLDYRYGFKLETGFLIFIATYTMYHVMSQQYGLALMMMRHPANHLFQMWRWTSVIAATMLYMFVFMQGFINSTDVFGMPFTDFLFYVSGALVVISSILGLMISTKSNTKQGRYYVYSNVAMVAASYVCLVMDYSAFVIIMPRVIHDITAFMIYSGHDQNRNANGYKNFIHGSLSFLRIPPVLLNPILAIAIAATVQHFVSYQTMGMIIIYCGLFHYYMEGMIWKKDAIHRKSLKFS